MRDKINTRNNPITFNDLCEIVLEMERIEKSVKESAVNSSCKAVEDRNKKVLGRK